MKKLFFLIFSILLSFYSANSQSIPVIGDFYEGGIVFWIDSNNTQGLVCDTVDLGSYIEWGCSGTSITTSSSIGSGLQNTLNIINNCSQTGIAAEICYNSTNNGYTDWYLPSKDELNEIYIHNNYIGLSGSSYWSSSDFDGIGNNPFNFPINEVAYGQNGSSGWQGAYLKVGYISTNSASDGFVRAIRSISLQSSTPIYGCTDSTATNYDPTANIDDGSCICTVAPYFENFDAGIGTTINNGWVWDAGGTSSINTGPIDDMTGGGYYMYYETSTGYLDTVTLSTVCLDISGLSNPCLDFAYHMYGAYMGTLDVSVNGISVWSLSGDQGNQWNLSQVSLSAYAGGNVTITFTGTYGGSYTGDMAIDNISVDECCNGNWVTLNMSTWNPNGVGWLGNTWTATGVSGVTFGPYTLASGVSGSVSFCLPDDCYNIACGGGNNYLDATWTLTTLSGSVLLSGTGHPTSNPGGGDINYTYQLSLDSSCVFGCIDSTALNYNPLATADDSSCIYCVWGCTNNSMGNYNPIATCDNGSCIPCYATANLADTLVTCDSIQLSVTPIALGSYYWQGPFCSNPVWDSIGNIGSNSGTAKYTSIIYY